MDCVDFLKSEKIELFYLYKRFISTFATTAFYITIV